MSWTNGDDGRTNNSPTYNRLCDEVERLIRGDASTLIAGNANQTARLIVAQLAHVHGLRPPGADEPEGLRQAAERALHVLGRVKHTSALAYEDFLATIEARAVLGRALGRDD